MKKILTPILFFIASFLQAQPTILWEKAYGGSLDDDAFCITRCYGNGFMIVGSSISNDGDRTNVIGSTDLWLLRINDDGDTLWQKSLGGTAGETPYIIRQMPDSGYIITARTLSNDVNVSGSHGMEDFWILRVDSSANIIWQKCFGGSVTDIACELKITPDGGFIICGNSDSNDGDVSGNHGFKDFWVIRLDPNGNLLWQKSYGGTSQESATAVSRTSDGGFLIGGMALSNNGDVSGNHGGMDYWVIKIDSLGTLLWQKTYGGTGMEQCMAMVENAVGNFMLFGYTTSTNGDVTGNHGSGDFWLVEIDSVGTLLWQKTYGGSLMDEGYHLAIDPAGNYILCGWAASSNGDVSINQGGYDYWIINCDQQGNLIWEKSVGGSSDDMAHFVIPLPTGNIIVTGNTRSSDGDVSFNHSTFRDYWTVMFQGPTTLHVQNSFSSTVKIINENDGIQISGLQSGLNYDFSVVDISGRVIAEKKFTGNAGFIPLADLVAGIYFLRVNDGTNVETVKFYRE